MYELTVQHTIRKVIFFFYYIICHSIHGYTVCVCSSYIQSHDAIIWLHEGSDQGVYIQYV